MEFTICIDENGYYTNNDTDNLVVVKQMPSVEDVRQLLAYKYDPETQELVVDEAKLAEINHEIENPPIEITSEERLADLENAFLELSAMVLGGK